MKQPNVWVIKCRIVLVDGSDGWHWRDYFPPTGWRPFNKPAKNWGGQDWIRSSYSKKLLREDLQSGDIGICYQCDDPENGRAILGLTLFDSAGKEDPPRSGEFNCFDLCSPNDSFQLNPPLKIKQLRARQCRPQCFGVGTQGTIFPVSPQEFKGIVAAVAWYSRKQGIELRRWLSNAGITTAE